MTVIPEGHKPGDEILSLSGKLFLDQLSEKIGHKEVDFGYFSSVNLWTGG